MKQPYMFGRSMKLVKKYNYFYLFIDEQTGIRECFSKWELFCEKRSYEQKTYNQVSILKRTNIKNDNRLQKIIKGGE